MNDPYVRLRADVNPVGWKAPTAFVIRRGGRLSAGMAPSMEVKAYQESIKETLRPLWDDLNLPIIEVPCRVDLYFSRQLVSYQAESGRTVTKHRQDLTNLRKSTEDALQPWMIKNDVLVTQGWTEIVAQSKTCPSFVDLVVYILDPLDPAPTAGPRGVTSC